MIIRCIKWISIWLAILSISAYGLTPEEVLERIDAQLYLPSSTQYATMEIVYGPDDVRRVEMIIYTQGTDTARIKILSPAREKDSEYLRREKSLWIYFPANKKTLLIQGHRLREGIMGSDVSYEDMTESSTLLEDYAAEFLPYEVEGEVALLLTAKVPDVSYYQRRVIVDTEHWVPKRLELISKSGKVLKEVVQDQVKKVEGRWIPHRTVMRDLLKQDTRTTITVTSLEVGVKHPDEFFTRRALGTR